MSMRGNEYIPVALDDPSEERHPRSREDEISSEKPRIMNRKVFILIVAVISVLVIYILLGLAARLRSSEYIDDNNHHPDPHQSASGLYRYAAVSSDNEFCSSIGTDILARYGGSAVDAAIATFICLGVINSQHLGLGGGSNMVIYERPRNSTERELVTLSTRPTAPLWATPTYFENDPDSKREGPKSIGVPCELKGYWEAWKRFGRVSWQQLFAPSIELCKKGWPVSDTAVAFIEIHLDDIKNDESLSAKYLKEDGSLYKPGDIMKSPKLKKTLEWVAKEGPDVFYTGELAEEIVNDIQDAGGIITMEDMASAKFSWQTPVEAVLKKGPYHVYSPPPSSSGMIVQFILKFMDIYMAQTETVPENYMAIVNKLIQAFQLGFARRSIVIGDSDFETEEMKRWIPKLLDDDYIQGLVNKMPDDAEFDPNIEGETQPDRTNEGGTSHLNILTPEGSAVVATSTLDKTFGSQVLGKRTGLLFNNALTLFYLPSDTKITTNYMEPRKRGRSSVSPTIIMNEDKEIVLLIGASGSRRIITAVSYVAFHTLFMNMSITDANSMPRLHDEGEGMGIYYDEDIPIMTLDSLREKGYKYLTPKSELYPYLGVCQGIDNRRCLACRQDCRQSCIEAVSDWRKMGKPDGY